MEAAHGATATPAVTLPEVWGTVRSVENHPRHSLRANISHLRVPMRPTELELGRDDKASRYLVWFVIVRANSSTV
jgi:hypothetical protein